MQARSRLLVALWLLVAFTQQAGFAQVRSGDQFTGLESSDGLSAALRRWSSGRQGTFVRFLGWCLWPSMTSMYP